MALLSAAQDAALRDARAQFKGVVGYRPLAALLDSIKHLIGVEKFPPGAQSLKFTSRTSTAVAVVGGACRLYGVRVESGATKQTATDADADVIVQVLDGTVVVGSVKCKQDRDAEGYFFGSDDGVGIDISSSGLNVKAVQAADGSSNPDVEDRPDVLVYFGV